MYKYDPKSPTQVIQEIHPFTIELGCVSAKRRDTHSATKVTHSHFDPYLI
jgi:hypothetical protein